MTEERIRNKEIRVRVSEDELKIAKDKAEYIGTSMSGFFRKIIMDDNINKLPVDEIKDVSKAINDYKYELNKIGNNINQLIKIIHENNDLYEEEEIKYLKSTIDTLIISFNELIKEIYERLYVL